MNSKQTTWNPVFTNLIQTTFICGLKTDYIWFSSLIGQIRFQNSVFWHFADVDTLDIGDTSWSGSYLIKWQNDTVHTQT